MPSAPPPVRIGRRVFVWGARTYVMGVLNVTPDSFAGDGITDPEAACARGRALAAEGADILDVGGVSTRPGAPPVSPEEELARVLPVVSRLAGELEIPLSVDTTRAEVARQAVAAGAAAINDVSALRADPALAGVVAAAGVPVILMHGFPPPRVPAADLLEGIVGFLRERVEYAVSQGVPRELILVDPGFGFGKSPQANLQLLRRLREVTSLGRPVVVGTSRKGTIGRVLGGVPAPERDYGTAATVAVAIAGGADVVRVHNVRAMREVARMADAVVRGWPGEPDRPPAEDEAR
jgi:dihydropteroate synthase